MEAVESVLWIVGALLFVLAILASIGLHELGHMIPAKAFGGKVTQYFIGFGPTVWSTQRGETEYGVKAVPLGGYVKIVGMLPPDAADALSDAGGEVTVDASGNTVVKVRKSNTGLFTQLISDARAAEWELVGPEDADRLFYKMPWWKKVVVMAGGPTVNILIAFFVFWAIFATYGNAAEARPDAGQPVVDEVSLCVVPYGQEGRPCTEDDKPSPAYEAGLRPGDVITTFNGVVVTDWEQLRDLIRDNAAGEAVIGYERDGEALTGTTNTTVELRPQSAEDETLRAVGFLGVTPTSHLATGGPIYTVQQMDEMAVETVKALANLPGKVWGVAKAIVGVQERDQDSPVSIVGGSRISGEIVSSDRLEVTEKVVFFGSMVAGFNFFIGMFNFIPLLPLDGGHIASALWEAVRRGFARLFGRPDPGYVDAAKLLPVAYVVASCLLVLSLVLIVGDIVVPVSIT